MNLKSVQKGYFDFIDLMFMMSILFLIFGLGALVVTLIVEENRPLKANTVAVETVKCDPVTVDSVEPYNCVITVKAPDQYLRDTIETNGFLQSLEYGQHRVDDPYPTHPEEDVDEAEASGSSLTITSKKDSE